MDNRGVSVTVSYILTLSITVVLISGLIIGAGSVVDGTKKQATHDGYTISANRMVGGIQAADRLVASGATTANVTVHLPERVAGTQYTVTVNTSSSPPVVEIQGVDADVVVTHPISNRTDIVESEVDGGDVVVVRRSDGKLEVQSAG